MKKIYGIRICKICKGICHEGSYRSATWRDRKLYFCSLFHLKLWIMKQINKFIPKSRTDLYFTIDDPPPNLNKKINENYEQINVITK